MKFTVKSGGVPPGSYVAKFNGVERRESKFGPGLIWTFEVIKGPNSGAKATGMTGLEPTPQNKCGKFLAGVPGKMPGVGESVDLEAHYGKPYLIVVEKTEGGGSKVSTVAVAPTAFAALQDAIGSKRQQGFDSGRCAHGLSHNSERRGVRPGAPSRPPTKAY